MKGDESRRGEGGGEGNALVLLRDPTAEKRKNMLKLNLQMHLTGAFLTSLEKKILENLENPSKVGTCTSTN